MVPVLILIKNKTPSRLLCRLGVFCYRIWFIYGLILVVWPLKQFGAAHISACRSQKLEVGIEVRVVLEVLDQLLGPCLGHKALFGHHGQELWTSRKQVVAFGVGDCWG